MREPRDWGESIAQRSQRSRRGMGLVASASVKNEASRARATRAGGMHRTEVTERDGVGGQSASVSNEASRARATRAGGKHRTEVTEGWGWWPKRFGEKRGVPCESHASGGKASHRGHRGHGEGWGWWPKRFGEKRGVPCESHASGEKASHRGHRGHGGGGVACESHPSGGKHRTEVTEV